MLCLHWEEKHREWDGYSLGKQLVPVDIVVQFHANTGRWKRRFCIRSVWSWATSEETTGLGQYALENLVTIRAASFSMFSRRFSWLARRPTECCYNSSLRDTAMAFAAFWVSTFIYIHSWWQMPLAVQISVVSLGVCVCVKVCVKVCVCVWKCVWYVKPH